MLTSSASLLLTRSHTPAPLVALSITIRNPKQSPGVILANTSTPMVNITFDGVRVINPGKKPWGTDYYKCEGVASGIAKGGTWPVPPCFKNATDP
mgnify:CR=1 FL=1